MAYAFLLDVSIKAAVVLAAACVAALAMRRASAASHHLAWCAAAATVLCLPALSAVLPTWHVLPRAAVARVEQIAPPVELHALGDVADAASMPAQPAPSILGDTRTARSIETTDIVIAVWMAGTLICLLPSLVGWWRLRRLSRRCEPITDPAALRLVAQVSSDLDLHRPITLLLRNGPAMPMTWGFLRPTVLLPRESLDWPHNRRRAVLLHELAHVKRLDCLTHLIGQLARAAYWFNPLAWLAVSRMSVERERACDDLVLRAGMRQSDYARELLAVGTTCPAAPRGLAAMAMAMARPSRMERRLRDVLDDDRDRRPLTRRHVLTAAAIVALLTLPLACVKSRDTSNAPAPIEQASLPKPIPLDRMTACQKNIASLIRAANAQASANDGDFPGMIGRTVEEIGAARKELFPNEPVQPVAQYYRCGAAARRIEPPAKPDALWLTQNTLYRYLAQDVSNAPGKFPPDTVMIHEPVRFDGHGGVINVGFWDGSVRSMDDASASRAIEASRARIDAAWAEDAVKEAAEKMPNRGLNRILVKSSSSMRQVGIALNLYGIKHGKKMPPTLGDAMEYGDDELSLQAKARMYLLPQDQHRIQWPARPTPQWINQNTSYVYLGGGVDLSKLSDEEKGETVVLHTKLDPPLKAPGGSDAVLLLFLDGHVELFVLKGGEPVIEKSCKTLDAARTP